LGRPSALSCALSRVQYLYEEFSGDHPSPHDVHDLDAELVHVQSAPTVLFLVPSATTVLFLDLAAPEQHVWNLGLYSGYLDQHAWADVSLGWTEVLEAVVPVQNHDVQLEAGLALFLEYFDYL